MRLNIRKLLIPAGLLLLTAAGFVIYLIIQNSRPPLPQGVLTPRTVRSGSDEQDTDSDFSIIENTQIPLVDLGDSYTIQALLDINLDFEQSDEQIILAKPFDGIGGSTKILIASTSSPRDEYAAVWEQTLQVESLSGASLRTEDVTGNGRLDIVVSGFDGDERSYTVLFAVPAEGGVTEYAAVFDELVDGSIEVRTVDRPPRYSDAGQVGEPYSIIVQRTDQNSENSTDILETTWQWDKDSFSYQRSETRTVKAETFEGKRIAQVYTGNAEKYESYLKGAWYRENGDGSYQDMLYFNPETREIIFFDGSAQEVFFWGKSHRTTAKKLHTKVDNTIIPAVFDTLTITAEDWDHISISRVMVKQIWDGSYRRLSPSLQHVLEDKSSLSHILSTLDINGVWSGGLGSEILFNLPAVEWRDSDGKSRMGNASLMTLNGKTILQIRFFKKDGSVLKTDNWIAEYGEEKDDVRVIRSLSLTPASLSALGADARSEDRLRFEQVEVFSPAAAENQPS